jgi:probable HAF family extracellular repeat protein
MLFRKLLLIITILFVILTVSLQSIAQDTRYVLKDLGTLGGTFSFGFAINNKGSVTGFSTTPDDSAMHAFLWREGVMTDLGTLGGINSLARDRLNERDQVAGRSETSISDPLGEAFCLFDNNVVCLPFIWTNGVMTPLPTLGGNNGAAHAINNRDQVVGLAENTTPDPTCTAPQVLQFKPVYWERGQVHQLPTFPGDPDGFAIVINDRGQAAGVSGDCTHPARHGLLWENDTAIDLGTSVVPQGINNRGQIVGSVAGRAFLWENGVMRDLGTFPGDDGGAAFGINMEGQVVGISCGENGCVPFLWQNGVMTDLNSLIAADSPLVVEAPRGINSRGEIVGLAIDTNSGEEHAFLALPKQGSSATDVVAPAAGAQTGKRVVVHNEYARKMLDRYAYGELMGSR